MLRGAVGRGLRRWGPGLGSRRTLLGESYACWAEWDARLSEEALKGADPHKLLISVEQRLVPANYDAAYVGAVDVDLAVQAAASDPTLSERFVELMYALRHTPSTAHTLPSTQHGLTAAFLRLRRPHLLLQALRDPINYGYFPDHHAASLLLDHLYEAGDFQGASEVAAYLMRQEMWDSPVAVHLACLNVVRLLETRLEPKAEEGEAEAEGDSTATSGRQEEEEELTFKVPWLKNRFSDHHFDLTEETQVLGKALAWLPSQDPSDSLAVNLRLLGYAMWDPESEEAQAFLASVDKSSVKVAGNLDALVRGFGADKSWEGEDGAYFGSALSQAPTAGPLGELVLEATRAVVAERSGADEAALKEEMAEWGRQRAAALGAQVERLGLRLEMEELEEEAEKLERREEELEFFRQRLGWEAAAQTEAKEAVAADKDAIPDDAQYHIPLPQRTGVYQDFRSAGLVRKTQKEQLKATFK